MENKLEDKLEDKLVTCECCFSDACYEHKQQGITIWSCMGCGFTINELMVEGSELVKETEEVMPELYKDIKVVDDKKQVWYPTVINIDDKGTVFVNGTSVDNWGWAGIKAVETLEEEKDKLKGAKYKSDPKTLKMFNQKSFDEACAYVGLF
jgi:ribosomal protein L37AE/L43A